MVVENAAVMGCWNDRKQSGAVVVKRDVRAGL